MWSAKTTLRMNRTRKCPFLLEAYGDLPAGLIYFEPVTARGTHGPSDALVCHPSVGVLVVEVKGQYSISQVEGAKGGSLMLRQDGRVRSMNVLSKTADKMFDIKNAVERELSSPFDAPLFNCVIAFPNITTAEWQSCPAHGCLPTDQLLFKEDLEPSQLRRRLEVITNEALRFQGREQP